MTITHHPNGTIRLTSLAEIGTAIDPAALADTSALESKPAENASLEPNLAQPDLANLLAELARMSGGLDTVARDDARARELATLELARYGVGAERDDGERALAEARRVRAKQLGANAFSEEHAPMPRSKP